MDKRALDVWLHEEKVGVLTEDSSGIISFKYNDSYAGAPISLSLPLSQKTYLREAKLFADNLTPLKISNRQEAVKDTGLEPTDFNILLSQGLESRGAIRFVESGTTPPNKTPFNPKFYKSLTNKDIAQKLHDSLNNNSGREDLNKLSIGGEQPKVLLYKNCDGQYFEALNGAPTTHILKPGVALKSDKSAGLLSIDEIITLNAMQKLGFDTASSSLENFNGLQTIVSARYDRKVTENGVARVHQEDFATALGIVAAQKYENDRFKKTDGKLGGEDYLYVGGERQLAIGATTKSYISLIFKMFNENNIPQKQQLQFARGQFALFALGNNDGHIKNFSLIIDSNDHIEISPFYDAASVAPFLDESKTFENSLQAIFLGGVEKLDNTNPNQPTKQLNPDNVKYFCKQADLDSDVLLPLVVEDMKNAPLAFNKATEDAIMKGLLSESEQDFLKAGISKLATRNFEILHNNLDVSKDDISALHELIAVGKGNIRITSTQENPLTGTHPNGSDCNVSERRCRYAK